MTKWKMARKSWVKTLQDFYGDFDKELTEAEEAMDGKRIKVPDEETDQVCELCGKPNGNKNRQIWQIYGLLRFS